MEQSSNKRLIASIVVVVAIVLLVVAATMAGGKGNKQTVISDKDLVQETAAAPSRVIAEQDDTEEVDDNSFADGTYTVNDTYLSPGGTENIAVEVVLQDGVVNSVSVTQRANNDESADHQAQFQKSYKSKVVGKSIKDLKLSRISGASLTTRAFNDALDQIRRQAQS